MYLIAGLGNPGKEYANTKHNIGFITIDYLAEKHGMRINKIKHKALIGEGFISGKKVKLIKPQTYMNLSGESLREAMEYYKADIEELIVIYDDIDIPMGSLRIRKKGSAGTHNGMRSIIRLLGDDGFPRIRIGIGSERGSIPLANYVTSGFKNKEEVKLMEEAVINAAEAIETFIASGVDEAMTRHNYITGKNDEE
jgi:PTH1 family peptidyl-tRNA hydrolase